MDIALATKGQLNVPSEKILTLDSYLSETRKRSGGGKFLIYGEGAVSYDVLDGACDSLARFLGEIGIRPGDRVALFLENSAEYVLSLLAILRAGAVAVPLSDQHTVHSARIYIMDFQPSAIILRRKMFGTLRSLFIDMPWIRTIILADGCFEPTGRMKPESLTSVEDLPEGCRIARLSEVVVGKFPGGEFPAKSLSDNAMIIYTSGTTGSPKGVVLTHGNIVANALAIVTYLRLAETDSVMVVLPFFYSYGNSLLTTHLISGGTLVLENNFLYPNVVLEKMVKTGVTGFAGVPSTFSLLLQRSNLRALRFPRLRYVTQAGGAMSPIVADQLREALPGTDVYIMYGQTEATARLTWLDPRDLKRKIGSIGKAIPGVTITLRKEDGTEAGSGETGEIVAQGGNIMLGYWNNPEETAKVLRPDGLHTGDLARKDDEGYLYIVGRRSDMIKSGAHRISPKEIEEVILEMEGVEEAVVFGMPDEILGETVCAVIVPAEGASLERKEVILHCREILPAFKVPKKIVFVGKLPKTSTGKVRRQDMPETIKGAQR